MIRTFLQRRRAAPGPPPTHDVLRLRAASLLTVLLLLVGLLGAAPAAAADEIQPGHLPYPEGGTTSVGAGSDLANQNAQLADSVPATVKAGWHKAPRLCPQSGGSGATSMSVTKKITVVNDMQHGCGWVSAYRTSTGKKLWRTLYPRSYRALVVGSTVYVQHRDADGGESLDALKLSTGKRLWSSEHVGDGGYTDYVPAVGSGLVMSSLRAVDQKTGAIRWSIPSDEVTGYDGATLITGGRVYLNSSVGVAAYDALTGTRLWGRLKKGAAGTWAGVQRPAVHAGRVYVSGTDATLAYDAETGELRQRLPGTFRPVAFDGDVGFFTTSGAGSDTVTAVDLTDGHTYWTYRAEDLSPTEFRVLTTAPVVSNGLVWVQEGVDTWTKGRLVALDEVTGTVRSTTTQACAPVMFEYASMTIAQHRIFTPSSCGVLTYVKK